jgi:hypothetical protein
MYCKAHVQAEYGWARQVLPLHSHSLNMNLLFIQRLSDDRDALRDGFALPDDLRDAPGVGNGGFAGG